MNFEVGDYLFTKEGHWLGKVVGISGDTMELMTPYGSHKMKIPRKETDMGVKVVVEEAKEDSVLIGIMKDGCDPLMTSAKGNLIEALETVPGLIAQAQEKWEGAPRNPAYKAPSTPKKEAKPKTPAPESSAPTQKTEDLPLLADIKTPPAETTESGTVIPESGTENTGDTEPQGSGPAAVVAEDQAPAGPSDQTEPPVEEKTETPPERTCRVCGCTDRTPCEPPCSWVEDDLCSACQVSQAKEPGLYLEDGRGPFKTVQEALDALGLPKEQRPNHNRYNRLSKELQSKIKVVA